MININETSENSKIYIQRNITNDEPVINNYVTEDELSNTLKNYATTEDLSNVEVDLTGYATEQWVDDKGYLKEIPEEYVTDIELANKNYVDTSYLNTELEGYAKQSYVDDAIANVGNGNIVELTQEEYNNTTPQPDTLYVISDAPAADIPDTSNFVDKDTLAYELDSVNFRIDEKQDTLISGLNIKTINGNDITGGGDITIEGGSDIPYVVIKYAMPIFDILSGDLDAVVNAIKNKEPYLAYFYNGYGTYGQTGWYYQLTLCYANKSSFSLSYHTEVTNVHKDIKLNGLFNESTQKYELTDITEVNHKYLTSIPEEYITETELSEMGYATTTYVDEQLGDINNILENIIG